MAHMASPSPRHRFQFSLRTLLLVTAAIAVVCWNASLTRGNWATFYNLNTSEFVALLIVARIKIWFSRKGPGEYKTFY
jgi:hypothetical protein